MSVDWEVSIPLASQVIVVLNVILIPMSKFAEPMSRLIDELKKLPGVGAKSAQRLAFHILRSSDEDAEALATAVRDVKANLRLCSVCNNITDVDPCVYCTSPTRNQHLVCVS